MCTPERNSYRLEIQRVTDGAKFPVGRIADAFLQSVRDQAIFLAQRRGFADAGEAHLRETPVFMTDDAQQISGVKISVQDGGQICHLKFGLELFAPAASMEAQRLATQGHLKSDEKFLYRVFAEPSESHQASVAMAGVVAHVRRSPLPLLDGQLSDLLSCAQAVGSCEPSDHPLFVTRRALDTAREYCRKPVDKEAGALMLGCLFQQRKPEPEIFGIIDDAIEVRHADQTLFRLDLTTDSFAYLQNQLRLRKSRLGRTHELALGFAHAHNFLPAVLDDGQAQCPECPKRATCQLTSSFYSSEDVRFHQALFGRAPYAVGLVWGFTPRMEDDLRVFCLDGGRARQRGYYLLHEQAHQLELLRRTSHAVG